MADPRDKLGDKPLKEHIEDVKQGLYTFPKALALCENKYWAEDDISWMNKYLKGGTDINRTDKKGNSLLKLAIESQNDDAVDYLLEKGADVHHKYGAYKTPMEVAAKTGYAHLVNKIKIPDDVISNFFNL